jgi:hypothetical protein
MAIRRGRTRWGAEIGFVGVTRIDLLSEARWHLHAPRARTPGTSRSKAERVVASQRLHFVADAGLEIGQPGLG